MAEVSHSCVLFWVSSTGHRRRQVVVLNGPLVPLYLHMHKDELINFHPFSSKEGLIIHLCGAVLLNLSNVCHFSS